MPQTGEAEPFWIAEGRLPADVAARQMASPNLDGVGHGVNVAIEDLPSFMHVTVHNCIPLP
jgi:hypothetical protein